MWKAMCSDLIIGPSTGWLYAAGIYSLKQQQIFLEAVGVNGVEVILLNWNAKDKRMLSLKTKESFDAQVITHRSLHLPDVSAEAPEHQLAMAKEMVTRTGATVALTHPLKADGRYPMECYEQMMAAGIPLAIENMDKQKPSGFDLAELEKIAIAVDCRFVLDVQHAYEHDPDMKYADELLAAFKDRLAHLHVSGETENNSHSLVCRARNANKIVDFVGRTLAVKHVPLILEGKYATVDELQLEVDFLIMELGL
jgi:hypothetical protein